MGDKKKEDIIEILATSPRAALVKRTRNGETRLGAAIKVKPGEPIDEDVDVVSLEARQDEPGRYNVKTLYEGKAGPARVATNSFRKGWDTIFGKKQQIGVS